MTSLVGFICEWGSKVGTEEDNAACTQRAVGVVAVRDGRATHALKVCMKHRMVLIEETDPVR